MIVEFFVIAGDDYKSKVRYFKNTNLISYIEFLKTRIQNGRYFYFYMTLTFYYTHKGAETFDLLLILFKVCLSVGCKFFYFIIFNIRFVLEDN